jgi:hypothetical protein
VQDGAKIVGTVSREVGASNRFSGATEAAGRAMESSSRVVGVSFDGGVTGHLSHGALVVSRYARPSASTFCTFGTYTLNSQSQSYALL